MSYGLCGWRAADVQVPLCGVRPEALLQACNAEAEVGGCERELRPEAQRTHLRCPSRRGAFDIADETQGSP